MRKNGKKCLKLLAKVLFSIAYVFVGAELFLRVFAPAPMLPRYICAADYGIRTNEGNRTYWHRTPEYKIRIRTNSRGIRADKEIPYEKPEGTKRIIVLGDSFGMGYGVNLEDTFTSQMEKYLLSAGIACEVVNLSSSGHGNAEELIVLRNEGLKYDPDLVLLVWHDSDYSDNVRSNLFALKEGQVVRKNMSYLPGVKIREFLFQFRIYQLIAGRSHFYNFIRGWAATHVKRFLTTLRKKADVKSNPSEPTTELSPGTQGYAKDLTVALLKEIQDECTQHGAKFMILDIPLCRGRREFVSQFPRDNKGGSYFLFNVFCPIELFKQQGGKTLYWERSHYHFTPLGCKIVGEGLAEAIMKKWEKQL